ASDALEAWIERGAHRKAAAIELILTEAIDNVAPNLLGEELGREDLGSDLALYDAERLRLGPLAFIAGGKAVLNDAVDDPIAPCDGAVREFERVVVAGRLGQGGEIGAISKRKLGQSFVPISLGRGSYPVGAGAEIDLVQVKLEGLVAREEEVLGHLLSDGRGADHAPSGLHRAQIGDDGPQDTLNVQAAMLIEILVLGGHEGLDDTLGNGGDRHVDAALARELGDERAVIGVNAGHHRGLVFGQHFVVRQLTRYLPQHEGCSARDGDEQNHARSEHETQKTQEKAAATPAPPLLRRLDWSRNVHGSDPSRSRF